jgi:hypothetical protein
LLPPVTTSKIASSHALYLDREKGRSHMKANLTGAIAAVLLMAAATFAQTFTTGTPVRQSSVPVAVREAFKSAYPQASALGYTRVEINGVRFYGVDFVDASTHRKIMYYPDGKVSRIAERIVPTDLPTGAQQVISEKYEKAKVSSAEKVVEAGQVTYEVGVRRDGRMFDLQFDAEGNLTAAREIKIKIVVH